MSSIFLKTTMMILMVLDHISYFISPEMSSVFHLITRPVAPVFAYLSVEGYIHTKNIKKYLFRLYTAAFIVFIGNFLLNNFVIENELYYVHNNIVMTLALGVSALYLYDNICINKLLNIFLLTIILILSLFTEGGIIIVPFMLISYIFRNNNKKINMILIAITAFLLPTALVSYDSIKETLDMFFMNSDILAPIAGLPFIYLYNGKKGSDSKFFKYIFYVFYPMHLWIIAIVADKLI